MKKYVALLSLVAALALLLSGCSMIKVDSAMQLEEDFAALKTDYDVALAEYDGGTVTRLEVESDYENTYYQLYYFYYYYYGSTDYIDDATLADAKQDVLETRVETEVCLAKAAERGIALTDEEIATCEATARTSYDDEFDYYYENYAEGDTVAEKTTHTEYLLYQSGITYELLLADEEETLILEKLTEQLNGEVAAPTDEEIQADFDEKVAADQASYTDISAFETALSNSTTYYWVPEGYRTVKHILLTPDEALLTAYTDAQTALETLQTTKESLTDELEGLADDDTEVTETVTETTETVTVRTSADVQADIDAIDVEIAAATKTLEDAKAACIANVQTKIDEINARLEAGESFEALVLEYSEDPGMTSGDTATTGYWVAAGSTRYVNEFTEAAMALQNVGDISEPFMSSYGVHIIGYIADVPSGAIDIATVKDDIAADLLSTKQTDYYNTTVAAWVEAVNPVYHADLWTD